MIQMERNDSKWREMKKNRGETHSPFLKAQNVFGGVGLKLPYIYPLLFFS
jgi:hypothetical protein